MQASMARYCPRLVELQGRDAGEVGATALELASAECLSGMCEHPEKLEGLSPSVKSGLKPMCDRLFSLMQGMMASLVTQYQDICPEVSRAWEGRKWSPSNHRAFYVSARQCTERKCAEADAGTEVETYCDLSADIAEGLGDGPGAVRLRAQAKAARERMDREWDALPADEKKLRVDSGMKILAKRWTEACRQGAQKFCKAVATYCQVEGNPPDVCPSPGSATLGKDAGIQ